MHKKILSILLFLLATIGVTAQSLPSKKELRKDSLNEPTPDSKLIGIATETKKAPATIFKKNEFPTNQKAAPAIFYIINDKPVSREEYVKQNPKINKN